MARDKKELLPGKQILIYPAVNSCYTEKSPYKSVKTNGTGYLLTSVKMEDYVILYQRTEEDRKNPYFAPVLAENLQGLYECIFKERKTAEKCRRRTGKHSSSEETIDTREGVRRHRK